MIRFPQSSRMFYVRSFFSCWLKFVFYSFSCICAMCIFLSICDEKMLRFTSMQFALKFSIRTRLIIGVCDAAMIQFFSMILIKSWSRFEISIKWFTITSIYHVLKSSVSKIITLILSMPSCVQYRYSLSILANFRLEL